MASNFNINKPYVLSRLPSPSTRTGTKPKYSASEIYGQQGGKKRKRTELAIGIDHDAVNLYDVSSAQIITSYPIPPQSSFTCAPASIRGKSPVNRLAVRYTYVSVHNAQFSRRSLTLFKDVLDHNGNTTSTTVSRSCPQDSETVHLSTTPRHSSDSELMDEHATHSLIAVAKDGSIRLLDGETLEERWQTAPSILLQELPNAGKLHCEVEFVQSASVQDVVDGVFEGSGDVFGGLLDGNSNGFADHGLLLLVTLVTHPSSAVSQRYLHFVSMPNKSGPLNRNAGAVHISSTPLPAPSVPVDYAPTKYQIDAKLGSLLVLKGDVLYSYTLTGSVARLQSSLTIPRATSYLRLSKTSVLACTPNSLEIYNPSYRALQAKTIFDVQDESRSTSTGTDGHETQDGGCELVSYFGSLEVAVALRGAALVAIQLEPPKTRSSKRRADGLLIDSIGRGQTRDAVSQKRRRSDEQSKVFSEYIPGTISDGYWDQWRKDVATADELLQNSNIDGFDEFLVTKLIASGGAGDETPPVVDRRWVLYAINKVVRWQSKPLNSDPHLSCRYPSSNTFASLVNFGHLSRSNIKSALKEELANFENVDSTLGEELPRLVFETDPTMKLLVDYLSSTKLEAVELLTVIRLVMSSLGLVHDPVRPTQRLLTNGKSEGDLDPEQAAIGMELDRAEEELQVTEYYFLGDQSNTRTRALGLAFSKLEKFPAITTVRDMRRLYKPEETLSLINILRTELIRDGWTTRYADASLTRDENEEEAPDGSIRIIADLLCRCVDSVGPSGWLASDAILASLGSQHETLDFFEQLKMEVSAALEGIEEAVRLRGILTQVVKYGASLARASLQVTPGGKALTKGMHKGKRKHDGKIQQSKVLAAENAVLPFGLKFKARVSHEKVGAGGEILQRTPREIGMLLSKKVGPYSVERVRI